MKETIMVFCAHPDDEVIGAGGTIANYAKEGKDVVVVISSYGESSHPWLKKRVTVEMRVKEAKKAGRILGCTETIFLGLRDTGVARHGKELDVETKIKNLIEKYRPTKIFTHSRNDPLPDHQSVHKIIMKIIEDIGFEGDAYSFDIWNLIRTRERNLPKMVVDITKTFRTKIRALKCFKSQTLALIPLYPSVYLRALLAGLWTDGWYGEVFYKIK